MDYDVFDLGSVDSDRWRDPARRQARLQDLRRAQRRQEQRDRLPDLVLGAALGQRVADRRGHGPGPGRYFIIVPEHAGQRAVVLAEQHARRRTTGARFPRHRRPRQRRPQHRLVTEQFGIERLALVTGWSMGAGQTYQWAVSYPEMVPADAAVLRLVQDQPSTTSSSSRGSRARSPPTPRSGRAGTTEPPAKGLRAAARVYAGWGFSQAFYWDAGLPRDGLRLARGLPRRLLGGLLPRRPRRQQPAVACCGPGRHGDVGATPGLRRRPRPRRWRRSRREPSSCRPRRTSTSRPRTRRGRSSTCANAELRVIPGVWGHFAGRRREPRRTSTFIDDAAQGAAGATDRPVSRRGGGRARRRAGSGPLTTARLSSGRVMGPSGRGPYCPAPGGPQAGGRC